MPITVTMGLDRFYETGLVGILPAKLGRNQVKTALGPAQWINPSPDIWIQWEGRINGKVFKIYRSPDDKKLHIGAACKDTKEENKITALVQQCIEERQ